MGLRLTAAVPKPVHTKRDEDTAMNTHKHIRNEQSGRYITPRNTKEWRCLTDALKHLVYGEDETSEDDAFTLEWVAGKSRTGKEGDETIFITSFGWSRHGEVDAPYVVSLNPSRTQSQVALQLGGHQPQTCASR